MNREGTVSLKWQAWECVLGGELTLLNLRKSNHVGLPWPWWHSIGPLPRQTLGLESRDKGSVLLTHCVALQ